MPLAFDSISHGSIAFGFFNIESDMLLLDLTQFEFFRDILSPANLQRELLQFRVVAIVAGQGVP